MGEKVGNSYFLVRNLSENEERDFRNAIENQLSLSIEGCDQVLSEYIIVMLKNRKSAREVRDALTDLVGEEVSLFFEEWILSRKELEISLNESADSGPATENDKNVKCKVQVSKAEILLERPSASKSLDKKVNGEDDNCNEPTEMPESSDSGAFEKKKKIIDLKKSARNFPGSKALLNSALKQSASSMKTKDATGTKKESSSFYIQSDFVTRKHRRNVGKRTNAEVSIHEQKNACSGNSKNKEESITERPRKRQSSFPASNRKSEVSDEATFEKTAVGEKGTKEVSVLQALTEELKSQDGDKKLSMIKSIAELLNNSEYSEILKESPTSVGINDRATEVSIKKTTIGWSGRGNVHGNRGGRLPVRGRVPGRMPYKNLSWHSSKNQAVSDVLEKSIVNIPTFNSQKTVSEQNVVKPHPLPTTGENYPPEKSELAAPAANWQSSSWKGGVRGHFLSGVGRSQAKKSHNMSWNRNEALSKSLNTPR